MCHSGVMGLDAMGGGKLSPNMYPYSDVWENKSSHNSITIVKLKNLIDDFLS